MLEDQDVFGICLFHLLYQVTKVVNIGFVGLTSTQKELYLLAAISTDTHGASHVAG